MIVLFILQIRERLFINFLFWSWIYRTWQGCRKLETFNTHQRTSTCIIISTSTMTDRGAEGRSWTSLEQDWYCCPPPGVTLYYNYTPCAFSLKIIGPLLRTACTESHPPIADRYKIYPPLLQSKVTPFADIQRCWRTGQDSYYTNNGWFGVRYGFLTDEFVKNPYWTTEPSINCYIMPKIHFIQCF
jgi:hypothetical protein